MWTDISKESAASVFAAELSLPWNSANIIVTRLDGVKSQSTQYPLQSMSWRPRLSWALTLKQHVITAYGGTEVKLSTTWRVNCQLQTPAGLYQGKKFFQCWMDSTVMTLGLVLASCYRADYCPCREPKLGRPAHIWSITARDIMTAARRGKREILWPRIYQQFFQIYEWDGPTLPTLHAYR